ncbi:NAD(P)-binding domain protein [Cordyceps fumosorosea ARSEF 2679]|uniref:NAD(P)-binding domain protein n=1 Tax=Cordyceps fumosorosea (strain ARSEF 2679) TaxID=1081104 RepID=A0A167UEM2_CORFA|nr:NAD(P)-binding domain protein [Cordyceps fumosorosea ARSEF 2679]OAA61509.1 NAD(P)-binding domain protein [Cordyceps fumosorosea ARSEF 2679]
MVTLEDAQASNAKIATTLPSGMVAVFVGGTSGIGEHTLKRFAEHTKSPLIYLVGRSREAADRITSECARLNPDGRYIFIQSDVSLLNNVSQVCERILSETKTVNLLFQTQGGLQIDTIPSGTTEGLTKAYVLPVTSRILFALSLLPALQRASGLRRVVSVFAAGHEGPFGADDWSGYASRHPLGARGHLASMITMAHSVLARRAPEVSFVHNFPGAVKTPFGKDATGAMVVVRAALALLGPLLLKFRPPEESSVLQLYCATSAAFPPATGEAAGIPLAEGTAVSVGSGGRPGSGSYNVGEVCERVSEGVEKRMVEARENGVEDRLWAHLVGEVKEITGKVY